MTGTTSATRVPPSGLLSSPFARGTLVFLGYGVLTLAWGHFMLGSLGRAFPHDSGDPLLNSWILWWNAVTLPFSPAWWDAPAFYPARGVAAFTENLVAFVPLTSPIVWITGNSVLAHNIALLVSFPLAGLCGYLLCREVTQDATAAFVGGLAFAFAPYRIAQMPHVQMLQACWLPLALFALHRYLATRRLSFLVLFGAAWILNAWTNGYYLLFLGVLLMGWLLWFVVVPRRWSDLVRIAAAAACASLPIAAVLWKYKGIHDRFGFARDVDEIKNFSADIAGLATASTQLSVWGWVRRFARPEGEMFPGGALLLVLIVAVFAVLASGPGRFPGLDGRRIRSLRALLAVAGVLGVVGLLAIGFRGPSRWDVGEVRISITSVTRPATIALAAIAGLLILRRREPRARTPSAAWFYAAAAPILWLLTLGPEPRFFGRPVLAEGWTWLAPYAWLLNLPGFDSLRVPARFWMLTVLCLAVIASFAFSRFAPRAGPRRAAVTVLVCSALMSDAWASSMPVVPAARTWDCPRPQASAAALIIPPVGDGLVDLRAMDLAMQWRLPSVNGYSGYFPAHYQSVVFGLRSGDHGILDDLAGDRGVFVAVPTRPARWREFVAAHPRAEPMPSCDGLDVFWVGGAEGARNAPKTIVGAPVPIQALSADIGESLLHFALDKNPQTRWHSGEQSESHWLQADLGESRLVTGAILEAGPFATDFPRHLTVSVSEDAQSWVVVSEGPTHRAMFKASVADPRRAPLTISFPPSQGRYVRFHQMGRDRQYWSIAELTILAR